MNDWRKPCEHGRYEPHPVYRRGIVTTLRMDDCRGGSPVTAADLEGEKVWWCLAHQASRFPDSNLCLSGLRDNPLDCQMVERLLVPIPDPQPATEGT